MKRLYEDYAYGPEPIKNCFWDRSVPLPQLPPLSGSRKVDVAVIGAGYTGLSAALHLAQDGAEVAVVDAETPFWGASGWGAQKPVIKGLSPALAMRAKLPFGAARKPPLPVSQI